MTRTAAGMTCDRPLPRRDRRHRRRAAARHTGSGRPGHRTGRHRLPRGGARQPVRRLRRRARRRPRLRARRPSRRARWPCWPPAPSACPRSSSTTSQPALGALARARRRAARRHRRRPHRLGRQDQHQGPDRPAAAAQGADGLHAGLAQQRDRAAADRAAAPTEDTRYLVLEMGARGIGHIRYLTGSDARRRSASSSTSAPRTSASSAAASRSPRPRASSSRRCPPAERRRRDPQRRRPARTRHGLPHEGPNVSCSESPTEPTYAPRTSGSRTADSPPSRFTHPPGAAT